MAKHYWPEESPIGDRVSEDNGKMWTTIVGVVSNIHQYGVDKDFVDGIYFPQAQVAFMGDPHLLIRTRNDPDQVARQMVSIIQQIDPQQPVTDIHTLDQLRSEQMGTPRVTSLLLSLFAG
jgi:hypothetical protein